MIFIHISESFGYICICRAAIKQCHCKRRICCKKYRNNGINRMWSLELSTATVGFSYFINMEYCDGNFWKVNWVIYFSAKIRINHSGLEFVVILAKLFSLHINCHLFSRYLEIVHPIWHKTNFKIRWIYISFAIIWLSGCTLTTAIHVPTTKVRNLTKMWIENS